MRDVDLRRALHDSLREQHRADLGNTLMLDELGLDHGTVFVDVAVLNGTIHGYELKSERDSLDRLPRQAAAYSATLDFATLVASSNHITEGRKLVPEWWGITEAVHVSEGRLEFRAKRQPRRNPRVDPLSVANLLWRDEALLLLEREGAARGMRGKPRRVLYKKLVEILAPQLLRDEVRETLKRRDGWRSAGAG